MNKIHIIARRQTNLLEIQTTNAFSLFSCESEIRTIIMAKQIIQGSIKMLMLSNETDSNLSNSDVSNNIPYSAVIDMPKTDQPLTGLSIALSRKI